MVLAPELLYVIMTLMVTQADKPRWGALIRAHRTALAESQTQFAKRWGVTQAAVSQWENEERDPPAELTWWIMQQQMGAMV